MLAEIQKDARTRMGKSLETLRHELAKIRTGRAHRSGASTLKSVRL